mmetsp:Transcript_72893/g.156130  ORF Transcript_72893/g.156130 Transcript_72893/m.156130 type:complete len:449 (-) Transcript_72893:55-1401(-)
MSFWGCIIKPGEQKRVESRDGELFHLSQACLDPSTPAGAKASVIVEQDGKSFAVAGLREGGPDFCSLDLFLDTTKAMVTVKGKATVHLTGYFEADEEAEDEDMPTPASAKGSPKASPKAASKPAAKEEDDEEEEEEEDDEEEEEEEDDTEDIAPPPAHLLKKGPRASVSAEAYGAWNQQKEYQAPVYAKTDDQKQRIRAILQESFLFASLENEALGIIVDAMQEKVVDKDTRMINQGDDGDFMYVVESGLMNCLKKSADGEDKVVKECRAGDAFGELALLYNCPRAASVVAAEKAVLWQLDRESFNHIVREAASKRRGRYEDFLKSVPILKTMENYEMQLMCDALQSVTFKQDELIVKQGDSGDRFFILEEGKCVVTKVYVEGTPPQEVMSYSSGDYFGELALLMNEPRAASVTALTDCRLLTLSRRTFKTLLGPLEDMLKRNASQYK